MTTFDRAALEALPIAPGSTGAIRERAFAQFQVLPVPSQETEEWRYTDLSDFALDFVPHAPGHGEGAPAPAGAGLAASILQHNSSVVMTTSGQDLDARGVISVTERQSYILRVRELAKACGAAWLKTEGGGAG